MLRTVENHCKQNLIIVTIITTERFGIKNQRGWYAVYKKKINFSPFFIYSVVEGYWALQASYLLTWNEMIALFSFKL